MNNEKIMKQVIVFPRGQLSPKDKERMSKLGICAVEADDPSKVVTVIPAQSVSGDLISMCALEAMNTNGFSNAETIRARFTSELYRRLKERESSHQPKG